MSRDILFRGKRADNGEWVEGYYFKMNETTYAFAEDYEKYPVPVHHYILSERMSDWGLPNRAYFQEVDPETVYQYTGLTDKNGRKIFEGDILRSDDNKVGQVQWFEEHSAFMIWNIAESKVHFLYDNNFSKIKVIGNIFDNPELLESNA